VGDVILVAGFEPTARGARRPSPPGLGRTAMARPVFDPAGEARLFETGRINWSSRDVDWKDSLGFRRQRRCREPVRGVDAPRGGRAGRPAHLHRERADRERGRAGQPDGGEELMIQSEGAEIFFRRIRAAAGGEVAGKRARSKKQEEGLPMQLVYFLLLTAERVSERSTRQRLTPFRLLRELREMIFGRRPRSTSAAHPRSPRGPSRRPCGRASPPASTRCPTWPHSADCQPGCCR